MYAYFYYMYDYIYMHVCIICMSTVVCMYVRMHVSWYVCLYACTYVDVLGSLARAIWCVCEACICICTHIYTFLFSIFACFHTPGV